MIINFNFSLIQINFWILIKMAPGRERTSEFPLKLNEMMFEFIIDGWEEASVIIFSPNFHSLTYFSFSALSL